ncbi:Uncharacterised protein [Vibrio cholerae]|nr:Uncharacterised protein [Vibrio cholerae]
MHVACRRTVGDHADRLRSGMCRCRFDFHINHCGQTTKALRANTELIHTVENV